MLLHYHIMKRLFAPEGINLEGIITDKSDANPNDPKGDGDPKNDKDPAPGEDVIFSQAQQDHIDGLIDKAYAKAAARYEKEYQKKLTALEEAEKAEKLKKAPDAEKLKIESEKRLAAEKQREAAELKLSLLTQGLPAEYADILTSDDEDKVDKAVEFLATYKANVEKPLNERIEKLTQALKNANLRGPAPRDFKGDGSGEQETLSSLIAERVKQIKN